MNSAIKSPTRSKTELEKRRKQALIAADKCKQILLNNFGSTEVILCGSLLLDLDEYRKFRHLDRHIYKIELKAERVIALAENIESVFFKIKEAVNNFNQWLETQS